MSEEIHNWPPEKPADGVFVKCGKCGGQIEFHTCELHDWVLDSICLDCGSVHKVKEKCQECLEN